MASEPPQPSAPTDVPVSTPPTIPAPLRAAIKHQFLLSQQQKEQQQKQRPATPPQSIQNNTQASPPPQPASQPNGAGVVAPTPPTCAPTRIPTPGHGHQTNPNFHISQLPSHPSPNNHSQAPLQPNHYSHPHNGHLATQVRGRPPAQPQHPPYQIRFPSPEAPDRAKDPRFVAECAQLDSIIRSAKPEVLHQVIRNSWEKTLNGSDYHNTFLMNILLNSAKHDVLTRSVKDFGKNWFKSSIRELAKMHFDGDTIDTISALIINKASSKHLDETVASRLETIEAQALVNMLGRAQRLGYNSDDIVEADPRKGNREVVKTAPVGEGQKLPSQQQQLQQSSGSTTVPGQQINIPVPTSEEIDELGIVFCESCERPCSGEDAFINHAKICSGNRTANMSPEMCIHCGHLFSTPASCLSHMEHNICGSYNNAVTQIMSNVMQLYEHHTPIGGPVGVSTPQHDSRSTSPTFFASEQEALASLSVSERQALEAAMKEAEQKYVIRQQEVMKIPDEAERKDRLARIKASFQSKQSMIRKKHGIRLRGRRNKTAMEAERRRLSANQTLHASHGSSQVMGSPIVRAPDAVKAQSGLTGTAATAETQDPTAGQQPMGTSTQDPMQIDSDNTDED